MSGMASALAAMVEVPGASLVDWQRQMKREFGYDTECPPLEAILGELCRQGGVPGSWRDGYVCW